MQVYDACVEALTEAGLIVIPNCHLLDPGWCCSDRRRQRPVVQRPLAGPRSSSRPGRTWRRGTSQTPWSPRWTSRTSPAGRPWAARVLNPTWGTGDETDFAAMYTDGREPHPRDQPGSADHLRGPQLRRRLDRRGQPPGPARAPRQGRLQHARLLVVPRRRASPGRRTSSEMNKAGGYILSRPGWPRCGSASSATTPGRWPISAWTRRRRSAARTPACGGTTSRPGSTDADVDWCWWALNPTHAKGTNPVHQSAAVQLGRPRAVRPADLGLARRGESGRAGRC